MKKTTLLLVWLAITVILFNSGVAISAAAEQMEQIQFNSKIKYQININPK